MYIDPYDNIQPEKVIKKEPEPEKKAGKKSIFELSVGPGVKKFAYFGLAIVIFSVFFKNNFNPGAIKAEAGLLWAKAQAKLARGKAGKAKQKQNQAEGINKTELISVTSFDGSQELDSYHNLKVEGIFFDANGGSFAVLNGKVISEGQRWMGITVEKINRESVEINVNGENRVLGVE